MHDHTTVDVEEAALQAHLTRIARTDPSWEVRLSAVDFLRDPMVLDEIAAADPSLLVRQAAALRCVAQVAEDGELSVIALTRDAVASLTRVAATRRISNPAALAQLAASQFDEQVRCAAVEGITEQSVLCHIAATDQHWSVRLAAVQRVEPADILARVARRDRNDSVRLAACARLGESDTRPIPRQTL